jgi:DNA processing protein
MPRSPRLRRSGVAPNTSSVSGLGAFSIRAIDLGDDAYPARLRELGARESALRELGARESALRELGARESAPRESGTAPPSVYVAGPLPDGCAVGIVGTRRADAGALAFAERLAEDLARFGIAIVSGGARGVDAAAHRGALRAAGRTLVVHGTSLDAPYPRAHLPLFAEILASGGAWLSETPPGTPAEPWRFLARNRLIAALVDAVVVVQAPARSGALSTARAARALGRPLLAVPAAPWEPRGEGALALLVRGDAAICRDARDVLHALGLSASRPQASDPRGSAPLAREGSRRAEDRDARGLASIDASDDTRRVLAALRAAPSRVDALVEATALDAARVNTILVRLSLQGLARRRGDLWCLEG